MWNKFRAVWLVMLSVVGSSMWCHSVEAAMIKDSESASHGDSAATYQVVETYSFPGFKVIQFNLAVLSHYSYMLISQGGPWWWTLDGMCSPTWIRRSEKG